MGGVIEARLDAGIRGVSAVWAAKIVRGTLRAERKKNYSVDVLVTGDRNIRKVNKRHLKHDYATDVIAFALEKERGGVLVSIDTARRYAKEYGLAFREELARYLVHGTLHLLGYDDKKPALKKRMFRRQETILKKVLP